MKDYYTILGIARTATEDEIKKAYRKLAHQYHPDKAGGDAGKFKEINEAYQVLSDKKKRANYDRFGTAEPMSGGFPGGAQWGGFPEGFGFGFDPQNMGEMGDLGDIFDSFMEGLGVRPRRRTYEKGSDLEIQEQVTLEEAFRGISKSVRLRTFVQCAKCSGKGAEPGSAFEQCSTCAGQGEIREQRRTFFGSFSQVKVCEKCHGSGEVPKKPCSVCKGAGRTESDRDVTVQILPGIEDGQLIKIQGMGEAGERGAAAGDLYVRVRVRAHATFERHASDLLVHANVPVIELLLGKKIEVPTISGGRIAVEIPAGFNMKDNLRVPGEGMPHIGSRNGSRGDLLVSFIIKAPKKPGAKAKKLLEDLEKES
ncbi:MAG TPA: molecular chaperone DnaJ [Candidatus Paceibacterota bacterium]|nr:molecular chaperone DnaJ [Candidatus Paceibacterota bacterium]